MKVFPITSREIKKHPQNPERMANLVVDALNKKLRLGHLFIKWPFFLDSEILTIVDSRMKEAGWGGIEQEEVHGLMFKLSIKEKQNDT